MSDITTANATSGILAILEEHTQPLRRTQSQLCACPCPVQRHLFAIERAVEKGIPFPSQLMTGGVPKSIHDLPDKLLQKIVHEMVAIFTKALVYEGYVSGISAMSYLGRPAGSLAEQCCLSLDRRMPTHVGHSDCLSKCNIKSLVGCATMLIDKSSLSRSMVIDEAYTEFRVSIMPYARQSNVLDDFRPSSLSKIGKVLSLPPEVRCILRMLLIDFTHSLSPGAASYNPSLHALEANLAKAHKIVAALLRLYLLKLESVYVAVAIDSDFDKNATKRAVLQLVQVMNQMACGEAQLVVKNIEFRRIACIAQVDVMRVGAGNELTMMEAIMKWLKF